MLNYYHKSLSQVLRKSESFPDIAQRVLALFRNLSRCSEVNSQMGAVGCCEATLEAMETHLKHPLVAELGNSSINCK